MAQDADNVVVGQEGEVWVAPVGTTAPVDVTTAMGTVAAAWIEVGHISEDGVTFSPTVEKFMVRSWQSRGRPIRRGVASREEALSFTMQEWKEDTLKLAFGGGAITEIGVTDIFKYTPPSTAEEDEFAFVVHWEDGGNGYRLIIPRGSVEDVAEFNLRSNEATGLPVTVGVTNDGSTDPFYIISNNTAWDPAA